ncbi:type II toxin-antitoxin system prevent-host-death family antitoxin [Tianweitania sp. BSSL-BM11]|uniref:Antitoxin n=2 Tax=Tianweitania aestuarii TaxID=2814886 RepID=A0ABS5RZP6_9HYPH|nr:type II toxin-antitoxin system prevent-host-death family antitoxin [Tianweitania aestuarii]
MNTVQLRDAKARLSALVDAAERGEATVITRHGKPAARIVPIEKVSEQPDGEKLSFAEWLLSMPGEMEFERDRRPMRVIDFD